MKAAVKDKWVAALRSNNYEQVQEALWETTDYSGNDLEKPRACLAGVLCDVAVREGVTDHHTPDYLQGEYGNVPHGVGDWAGIDNATLEYVVALNDEYGVTFDSFASLLDTVDADGVELAVEQLYQAQQDEEFDDDE